MMNVPHLRIAITSNSLIQMDANFVGAKQFLFYDVSEDNYEFIDAIHFTRGGKKGQGGGKGQAGGGCVMDDMEDDDGQGRDPLVERVEAVKDCSVLFTLGLSDLAAVRVHSHRVFPVKSEKVRDIDDVITNLQRMMKGVPPLWLRRSLRDENGQRMILQEQCE